MSYTAVNRWWMDRRASAIATINLGGGSSGIWGGPLTVWLCNTFGWRLGGGHMTGIIMFVVCCGAAFLYPHHMPEHYGLFVDNVTPEQRRQRAVARRERPRPMLADLTTAQALRSWTFWAVVLAGAGAGFGGAPVTPFQNIRMGAAGYTKMEAAIYFTGRIACSYVGRLTALFAGDWLVARIPVRYVMALCMLMRAIGMVFFAMGMTPIYFIGWAVVEGIGYGGSIPFLGVLMGAYFGRLAFGMIYGLRTGLATLGTAAAPFFVGWLSDVRKGDWVAPFLTTVVAFVLSAIFYLLAIPPKEQARERGEEATS
jgi:MFS family permease